MLELYSSIIATLMHQAPHREKAKQEKQLVELQDKLAQFIASKMRKHYEDNWKDIPECRTVGATLLDEMPRYDGPESRFWRHISEHIATLDSAQAAAAASAAAVGVKQGRARPVEEELETRAIQMDSRGRMIGSQETITVAEKHKSVTIPFQEWLSSKVVMQ